MTNKRLFEINSWKLISNKLEKRKATAGKSNLHRKWLYGDAW